jgi:hypothetical protein
MGRRCNPTFDVATYQVDDAPGLRAPRALTSADFDGDGFIDLALLDAAATQSIYVFLGRHDGSVQLAITIPVVDPTAQAIASGDFDGDGFVDLAYSAGQATGHLWQGRGRGDGTFEIFEETPVAAGPVDLAVGDLDGDGRSDLVVASEQGDAVSLVYGAPAGTPHLLSTPRISVGRGPTRVAIGDVDGDGDGDLVVAARLSHEVAVLLGNGARGFGPPTSLPLDQAPTLLALADLDADGDLDIATGGRSDGVIALFDGDGNGTFSHSELALTTGPNPTGLMALDADSDGEVDIVTVNRDDDANRDRDSLWVASRRGDRRAVGYRVGLGARALLVGDFNQDERADIAVASEGGGTQNGSLTLLLGYCR